MNKRTISIAVFLTVIVAVFFLYKGDLSIDEVDAKYSSSASKYLVTKSGARVHYRDQGNPEGLPIVLVHGSNASLHTWEPWVALLGNDYRLITLDLPGHGLTGRTSNDDYSNAAFVQVVDEVVNHLNIDKFVLGGNSMGGGVTWRYTIAHPDKVLSMILVDASGLPQWMSSAAAKNEKKESPLVFKLLTTDWFRPLSLHLEPYFFVKQGVHAGYNNSVVINDELIMRYYELYLRKGTRFATMKRFAGYSTAAKHLDIDFTKITQPVLILWGEEDSLISVDIAHMFDQALPNSTLVIYKDTGHAPMEEIAERTANDVRKFLVNHQLSGFKNK